MVSDSKPDRRGVPDDQQPLIHTLTGRTGKGKRARAYVVENIDTDCDVVQAQKQVGNPVLTLWKPLLWVLIPVDFPR